MPSDEQGHSTREACGHPFVTDDCIMCEVDTMKRETANLQRQIKELRTPVEKVTLGGVDMSPNYKGDGMSDGWVPYAELARLRAALETLIARVDEMPNPHADPMRHYYNQMATWKDDARAALEVTP